MQNISKLSVLATILLLGHFASAQSQEFDRFSTKGATKEQLEAKNAPRVRGGAAYAEVKIAKPEGYPAKDIPKDYNGYRIEILVADSLLKAEDDLFFRHGNIMLESLSDGRFAYTVGDFQNLEAASNFMQQFILPKYQEARVVGYKEGRRN